MDPISDSRPTSPSPASRWTRIRAALHHSLGRFPWVTACCLLTAAALCAAIEKGGSTPTTQWALRIALTSILGIPLLFAASMAQERLGPKASRIPLPLFAIPLLIPYLLTLPEKFSDTPQIVQIRWALLLAGLHFLSAIAAHLAVSEPNGFWQFNRRLFSRFFLATLYTGVLTAGLELALVSANLLFDLKLEASFFRLLILMAFAFHPIFFLAGVPADLPALEHDTEHPRGLKAFTQFALAPIVAVFTAILYAYSAKILLSHSWPRGWVALPVLLLAGVGILTFLLLHPLRSRPEEKWAAWFCRNFPPALAPLALLLLLSVRERISAYGITEERHLGVVAGSWILLWALVFALRPRTPLRWVPASLALLCLASAYGPLSAASLSVRSQHQRLLTILSKHGLLHDQHLQKADAPLQIPDTDYNNLQSILAYLGEHHGPKTLLPLLPPTPADGAPHDLKPNSWRYSYTANNTAGDLLKKLNILPKGDAGPGRPSWRQFGLSRITPLPIEGFSKLTAFKIPTPPAASPSDDSIRIEFSEDSLLITLPKEPPQKVSLKNIFESLSKEAPNDNGQYTPLPPERLSMDWQHQGREFRILFTELWFSHQPSGAKTATSGSLILLEK